jgi:hypothetical protein
MVAVTVPVLALLAVMGVEGVVTVSKETDEGVMDEARRIIIQTRLPSDLGL